MKKFHLNYRQKRLIVISISILILIAIYFLKNASFTFRAIGLVTAILAFYIIDHFFDVRFRKIHYVFMFLIVALSILLSPFYFIYPNYDKIQHFFNPILVFTLIFYMVNKLRLELKWKLVFTFFIVVAILCLFEIGEYALDYSFNLKLQGVYLRDIGGIEKLNLIQDPLSDTITDLILGVLGAGIYWIIFALIMREKLSHKIFK